MTIIKLSGILLYSVVRRNGTKNNGSTNGSINVDISVRIEFRLSKAVSL